jgi:hypothetical protein
MRTRLFVALVIFSISFPAAAATQSEGPLLRPRVSKNQSRSEANRSTGLTGDFAQDTGPGAGNGGASSCQKDQVCRTREGHNCKAFTGLTCYTWLTGDGVQKCNAC